MNSNANLIENINKVSVTITIPNNLTELLRHYCICGLTKLN